MAQYNYTYCLSSCAGWQHCVRPCGGGGGGESGDAISWSEGGIDWCRATGGELKSNSSLHCHPPTLRADVRLFLQYVAAEALMRSETSTISIYLDTYDHHWT